jgi:hypothetical protein
MAVCQNVTPDIDDSPQYIALLLADILWIASPVSNPALRFAEGSA